MAYDLRIRLVTGTNLPDGDDETRFLAEHLEATGWKADIAVWSNPDVDWSEAPVTVIRSTWDYPEHLDDFLAWTQTASQATELHNSAELIRRNVDKRYLLELAAAGVTTVPSRWVETISPGPVRDAMGEEDWSEVVLKPCVGVDGTNVVRIASGSPIPQLPECPEGWLIQPFLSEVVEKGERSVVFFGGEVSHVVCKRAGADDFRVQERWGGRTGSAPDDEDDGAITRLAREALTATTGPESAAPLYARVDLLPDDHLWLVTEVELIEPSFYLDERPERAAAFERAVRARGG